MAEFKVDNINPTCTYFFHRALYKCTCINNMYCTEILKYGNTNDNSLSLSLSEIPRKRLKFKVKSHSFKWY